MMLRAGRLSNVQQSCEQFFSRKNGDSDVHHFGFVTPGKAGNGIADQNNSKIPFACFRVS